MKRESGENPRAGPGQLQPVQYVLAASDASMRDPNSALFGDAETGRGQAATPAPPRLVRGPRRRHLFTRFGLTRAKKYV